MVTTLFNKLMSGFFKLRMNKLEYYSTHPEEMQSRLFNYIVEKGKKTEYGKGNDFNSINSYQKFTKNVPVVDYEDLREYVIRMMQGQKDILWPGKIKMFSKSSGTTSDRSKYIPVSNENLRENHIAGAKDAVTLLYNHNSNLNLFKGKSLVMGGSLERSLTQKGTVIGDISALMLSHTPFYARPFYTPGLDVALMSKWENKIELMADAVIKTKDMTMFGGVPTWVIVLFRRILQKTGKENILEVLPNIQAYIHGGVGFEPYRAQFKALLPSNDIIYQNVYNASEGYFATQNEFFKGKSDMLLLVNNGIFYEFAPMENGHVNTEKAVPLSAVKTGINYTLIITNNSGLWRYMPGDTVEFTSISPYKINITGRTRQFINAFGEEVMIANTDKAIEMTCSETNSVVSEYTVAPVYFGEKSKGGHQWMVEFEKEPTDLHKFTHLLDENLQKINSDYQAKRTGGMAMELLQLTKVSEGTFHAWMKSRGKVGGQNKIPRLSNDRSYVDELNKFIIYKEN